jgi:DNA invertase Pin-like site-specific DNA recombinase
LKEAKRMATLTLVNNGSKQITFEDLKGMRAEGYIRDSTLDQRDGFGAEIQTRNIQGFAEKYDLFLGNRWYTEFVSSFRRWDRRSQLRQFVEDARLDRYDVLLVDHTSRFGRNQRECISYKEELQALGKIVVFVSQSIISGTDRDFLAERINETLDEQYSRNLSRYVGAGMAEKAAQGLANGKPPLGYRSEKLASGKRERKVPDSQTLPVLLELLHGYATGRYSYWSLAAYLNAQGYRARLGQPFSEGSIRAVLDNRFYEGKVVYHPGRSDEEVRDGTHEVPQEVKDLWLRCQEVRSRRSTPWSRYPKSAPRVYLFSGVLTCDACGSRYKGQAIVRRPHFFQRLSHQRQACPVRPQSLGMKVVTSQFAERVLPYLRFDADFTALVTKALAHGGQQTSSSIQDQMQRLERALDQLRKQHQWGDLPDEDYIGERDSLRRQLQALKASVPVAHIPNLRRVAELLNDMPALWQHPGVEDRQRQEFLQRPSRRCVSWVRDSYPSDLERNMFPISPI